MQSDAALLEHDVLTISEMSNLHDVSLRTLRFYEQVGLLQPQRVGARRLYSPKDRVRLEIILTGKRFGFSLREIDAMLRKHRDLQNADAAQLVETLDPDTVAQQIDSLERQKAAIEAAIGELTAALATTR